MSKLNIACLLSPMADTEGPMDIVNGKALTGPKKIMGKYGEIGLETTITFGEQNPNTLHTDILTVGKQKEVTTLQQSAIAMFQPAKHPGTLGVHALYMDDIDDKDGFEVAGILVAMINNLEHKPDLIFSGRESFDYGHGVVGPSVARHLGYPYYSGVKEIALKEGMTSVTATFEEGNDKIVMDIPLPAVFGTTDWLNGKDSARFTSLKGVMMAKKFKRTIVDAGSLDIAGTASKTVIQSIIPVKSERKNRKLEGDEGPNLAKKALDILVSQDKALAASTAGSGGGSSSEDAVNWAEATGLDFTGDVAVIGDHDGAVVRKSTHQALSQARKIADASGKQVTLFILAGNIETLGAGAGGFGADRVIGLESDHFVHPTLDAYAQCLGNLFTAPPAFLVTVANDLGRDLAAYMAASFGGGLLQDVVALDLTDNKLTGSRIVSNARYTTQESITVDGSQVVSVRATAFDPVPRQGAPVYFKMAPGKILPNASIREIVSGEQTRGVPLNEAKIIVSGGRGMKAADNFKHLHTLSELLGGAVGASRAVTDLDWVAHNLQIGQTGTTVAPDIYFAIGISGAIQHLTGMLGSKYVVAINPDADAPIHTHADLSIIDKWENVLEPLTEEIKAVLGK